MKLYEAGITDKSVHASQTNIGLINLANEENSSGCDCSSTSLWGVLEVLATMVVCVLLLYIAYTCLVGYCTRKKAAKEKQHQRLLEQMETKLSRPNQLAIKMSPSAPECNRAHMHIPDYQTRNQNTSRSTQQSETFSE